MTVTFASFGASGAQASVELRDPAGRTSSAAASGASYQPWNGTIYKATLTGLDAGAGYDYQCVVGGQRSGWFSFKGPARAADRVHLAIVADLDGREPAGQATIRALNQQAGAIDALLHAGDIAYIKGPDSESIYDEYFRQIQPAAAAVPYHVAVGNQEHWNNFSGFDTRFGMPGGNFWHSADFGPVHALFISTEHPYSPGSAQYQFVLADLQAVDRTVTPWLMVLLHRPLYCSTNVRPGAVAD